MRTLINYLFVVIFSLVAGAAQSQQGTITGNNYVAVGAYEEYGVSFPYMHSASTVSWSVSGGTLLWSSQYGCAVQWDNANGVGQVSASEDLYGQWADYTVYIGDPAPYISPDVQMVNYGQSPGYDPYIYFSYPPTGSVTYQWQEWSFTSQTWNDIVGQTADILQPGPITISKRYRCLVDVNGTLYDNLVADIIIPALTPGSLVYNGSINFNGVISTIGENPASGGFCTSYSYVWEKSIENGPWQVIGTSQASPSGISITGAVRIRRKVICGTEELYSNTLFIDPVYVPGDYENLNYIRNISVQKKGVLTWQEADALAIGDKLQSTEYVDGFGRIIQNVEKGTSPAANNVWKDLVKHYEYDAAGRSAKDFLVYATIDNAGKFKTNAATAQPAYIQNFYGEPATAPTYALQQLESSELGRVVKTMAPGDSWGGSNRGISFTEDFNTASESIHIWSLAYSAGSIPVTGVSDVYPEGKILRKQSTDEKGNKTIVYSDLFGNIILKKVQEEVDANLSEAHAGWACTYNVYDDLGNLRFIISPKAVKYLDNNGWNLTQAIVDELCYVYRYDAWGRIISSKKPGAGEAVTIYEKNDLPILTQDAGQKAKNHWLFTLYDRSGRVVATGIFENGATAADMQTYVDTRSDVGVVTVSAFAGNGVYQAISVYNPIAGSTNTNAYCNGCNAQSLTYNTIDHFDDYSYAGVKVFDASFTLAYNPNTDPNIEPSVPSSRIKGFQTGSKVRILDTDNNPLNDKFQFSTTYYNDKSRALQVHSDNIKGSADVKTLQYDFSGKMVSAFIKHSSGTDIYTVTAKYLFDKAGRLTYVLNNFNNTFYKFLSGFTYDELGRQRTKDFAPGYNSSYIEQLVFDYNIQGAVTGINKDYALSANHYTQWDHYFGLYLGYDKKSVFFADEQYNGNITGLIWRSQGDNAVRKYDFTYGRLNELTSASFSQGKKPNDLFISSEVDFSVAIEYEDGNGNLKSMKQMGILPGLSAPMVVDDLRYVYNPVSGTNGLLHGNKLARVTDLSSLGANNGKLADFKDGANPGDDYEYDANGNLTKDLNKNITENLSLGITQGVTYNYLNKPEKILVDGKSIVDIVYNARGEKLSRKVTPAGGGTAVTTYYAGDFIYKENDLEFILHDEGRLKIITPHTAANPFWIDYTLNAGSYGINFANGKQGVFEYFIKDHLGSTRMVLTEEEQKEFYKATMEANVATTEEGIFGKVNDNGSIPVSNELQATRLSPNNCISTPWPGNCTDIVQLTAAQASKKIGPNMVLKVMAGDIISSKVDYYYLSNNDDGPPAATPVSDVINSLISAITSPGKTSDLGKSNHIPINTHWSGNTAFQSFISNQNIDYPSAPPRAYLNIIFLDEQFKFVEPDPGTPGIGSACIRMDVPGAASVFKALQQQAPKNGWVFVYLSNQSNESVYFDNFIVTNEHKRIAEETHYYPFGLKIASISSKAFNKLPNKYNFQGESSEEEPETGWDEFHFRMYDPQIGRWTGSDPEDVNHSPYIGMNNDPVNLTDPDGADPDPLPPIYVRNGNTIYRINFLHSYDDFLGSIYAKTFETYIGTTLKGSHTGLKIWLGIIDVVTLDAGTTDRVRAVMFNKINLGHVIEESDYLISDESQSNFVVKHTKSNSGVSKLLGKIPVISPLIKAIDNLSKGKFGKALGNLAMAGLDAWTGGLGGITRMGLKEAAKKFIFEMTDNVITDEIFVSPRAMGKMLSSGVLVTGGRWGNEATQRQLDDISNELMSRGYTITNRGSKNFLGRRWREEYLPPLLGGRKGGSYPDITATHPNYGTLRINTVDTYKRGARKGQITKRELDNAARIRAQTPGEHLLLIKKNQ